MDLVQLLILLLVLCVVFWLLATYVAPALPPPLGKVVLAIFALIVIAGLLSYFFGWGGLWHRPVGHR